jgi:hypothetical protein
MVRAAGVATQRCRNHISAAVNQHATIDIPVFSVDPSQGYVMSNRLLHNPALTDVNVYIRTKCQVIFCL